VIYDFLDSVRFLTESQLAKRHGVSVSAVRKWRRVGKGPKSVYFPPRSFPEVSPKRRYLYKKVDVLDWEKATNHFPCLTTAMSTPDKEQYATAYSLLKNIGQLLEQERKNDEWLEGAYLDLEMCLGARCSNDS